MEPLLLDREARREIWAVVEEAVEAYLAGVGDLPVAPRVGAERLREWLRPYDFQSPTAPLEAVRFAVEGLRSAQLHTSHPAYFGVFNPHPTTMGFFGEMLAGAFNPQLASWISSPFAIEVEQHTLRAVGGRVGFGEGCEGNFTSGGTEANHTAVLAALTERFADFTAKGVRGLPAQPTIYVATECHHSFVKAARLSGLGDLAVREIPVRADLKLDPVALDKAIDEDRRKGFLPFFAVATLGTTNAGVFDDVEAAAEVAQRQNVWLHLDAAWGGPAAIVPELSSLFAGVGRADSITIDAHKLFSVPMTAGMVWLRRQGLLEKTFRVGGTSYMPPGSKHADQVFHPYAQSMGWSRRFVGLKLFLSLAVAGWDGYRETFRRQCRLADRLRAGLGGWKILNDTKLPVVCFTRDGLDVEAFAKRLADSGKTWVTTTKLGSAGTPCLRAGITNFRTDEKDIDALLTCLDGSQPCGTS